MSNIDLSKFVNVNIVRHEDSVIRGTRDTAVLFTTENAKRQDTNIIDSLNNAKTFYDDTSNTYKYLRLYFLNGGVKVKLMQIDSYTSIDDASLTALSDDEICVACVATSKNERELIYAHLKSICEDYFSGVGYGIHEKLILASTSSSSDTSSIRNFIAKYVEDDVLGAEMTIAAYLSKIDVYGIDTVHDYMFTKELLADNSYSNIDTVTYETLMTNNMNADIYLANAIRNVGGNCKDGADIVNNFVRIILQQTLTTRLLELLTQKIKSADGISKIYTVIASELDKYLACGYLTTDKVWQDVDFSISYNGSTYTIIEQGTALTSGYVVRILPMTALTAEDKAQRKTPPIYIVLADQYGIRKITINGEVI